MIKLCKLLVVAPFCLSIVSMLQMPPCSIFLHLLCDKNLTRGQCTTYVFSTKIPSCSKFVQVCLEKVSKLSMITYPPCEVNAATVDQTFNLCTRYPLLLGARGQCGFKARPRLLPMTGATEIEPLTPRSRVLCLNHSAMCLTAGDMITRLKTTCNLCLNSKTNFPTVECLFQVKDRQTKR